MEDLVHLQQDGLHHVVPDELKVLAVQQVGDVVLGPGKEVVQADDLRVGWGWGSGRGQAGVREGRGREGEVGSGSVVRCSLSAGKGREGEAGGQRVCVGVRF